MLVVYGPYMYVLFGARSLRTYTKQKLKLLPDQIWRLRLYATSM